jgi:hypothetical protein
MLTGILAIIRVKKTDDMSIKLINILNITIPVLN